VYETDPTPNAFPRLPVRPANCLVWLASGDDPTLDLPGAAEQLAVARAALHQVSAGEGQAELRLDLLRLLPTTRSTLLGRQPADATVVGS
jgi:hypothetical protein